MKLHKTQLQENQILKYKKYETIHGLEKTWTNSPSIQNIAKGFIFESQNPDSIKEKTGKFNDISKETIFLGKQTKIKLKYKLQTGRKALCNIIHKT